MFIPPPILNTQSWTNRRWKVSRGKWSSVPCHLQIITRIHHDSILDRIAKTWAIWGWLSSSMKRRYAAPSSAIEFPAIQSVPRRVSTQPLLQSASMYSIVFVEVGDEGSHATTSVMELLSQEISSGLSGSRRIVLNSSRSWTSGCIKLVSKPGVLSPPNDRLRLFGRPFMGSERSSPSPPVLALLYETSVPDMRFQAINCVYLIDLSTSSTTRTYVSWNPNWAEQCWGFGGRASFGWACA